MSRAIKIWGGAMLLSGMFLWSCDKEVEAPVVEITKPEEDEIFLKGEDVEIEVYAEDMDGKVEYVNFYINGYLIEKDSVAPWASAWTDTDTATVGGYRVYVIAYDDEGEPASDGLNIIIDQPSGFNPDLEFGSMSDVEGNSYKTIAIGEQTWMAENLKTTRYADGSSIPQVTDSLDWKALDMYEAAYCWFNNEGSMGAEFGGLYTWAAAYGDTSLMEPVQGVCPDGWHLPSDQDWKDLELHLGMSETDLEKSEWRGEDEEVGNALKEMGYSHWEYPSAGNDSSGFRALPAGFRSAGGGFYSYYGTFWTSTEDASGDMAWFRSLLHDEDGISRKRDVKNAGYSVRCVKD